MSKETIFELYEVLTAMAAGASLAVYLILCWNIIG